MSWKDWLIAALALLMAAGFIFHGCISITQNFDLARDLAIAVIIIVMIIVLVIDNAIGKLNATLERLSRQ